METTQNEIHITPPVAEVTEIVCILDRSGSMGNLVSSTIEGYNTFLKDQKALPDAAKWTLCLFDGGSYGWKISTEKAYEIVHDGVNIQDVPELTTDTYKTNGGTAMYDAIGATLTTIYDRVKSNPNTKVIVMIITDGEENSSVEYKQQQVFDMIKMRTETDKWAFLFLGANIDTMQAGSSMYVSKGNTMAFSSNHTSNAHVYANMSASTALYRSISKSDLMNNIVEIDGLIDNNGVAKDSSDSK